MGRTEAFLHGIGANLPRNETKEHASASKSYDFVTKEVAFASDSVNSLEKDAWFAENLPASDAVLN